MSLRQVCSLLLCTCWLLVLGFFFSALKFSWLSEQASSRSSSGHSVLWKKTLFWKCLMQPWWISAQKFWWLSNLTIYISPWDLPETLTSSFHTIPSCNELELSKCLSLVRIWPLWGRSRKCHQYPSVSATTQKHLFSYSFTPQTINFVGMPGWNSKPFSYSSSALHSLVILGLHLKHIFGCNQYPLLRVCKSQNTSK